MDESSPPSSQRLLEAIEDPSARAVVSELLLRAEPALRSLADIDKSIDNYFSFFKDNLGAALEMIVPEVRLNAFRNVGAVLDFLSSHSLLESADDPIVEISEDATLDPSLDDEIVGELVTDMDWSESLSINDEDLGLGFGSGDSGELELGLGKAKARAGGGGRAQPQGLELDWGSGVDSSAPPDPAEDEDEDDFDFGEDFDMAFSEPKEGSDLMPVVGELDIEAAMDALNPEGTSSQREKLEEVSREVMVIAGPIREQLESAERRIGEAFALANHQVVIRELDEARESLTEGLFALLGVLFEAFIGSFERSMLVPEYKDALQKSLMVRRGLAKLARVVTEANALLQNEASSAEVQRGAVSRMVQALEHFRASEVFRAMRPPDRWEFASQLQELYRARPEEIRLAAEGYARYLESLSVVVSQREVLIQHDQEAIRTVRGSIDAARSLMLVSVAGARTQVEDALQAAFRLRGYNVFLDQQLGLWSVSPPSLETEDDLGKVIEQLDQLV